MHVSEMTAALTVGIFVKGVFSIFKNFTIFLPFMTKISLNMIVGIIVFELEKLMKFSHLFSVFIILIFDRIPNTTG